jgi:hypothetical protein
MSATTIPRDISQAVGNAFLIFGKFFLGMAREEKREETEEEWRDLDQGRGKGGIGTMRLMSAR